MASVGFEQLLSHRLLLLNLGKGSLGTDGANFLGAVLLSQVWSSLQERPAGSPPVYLVVDEFHNYAVPAFADMLSEGAGLGLHIIAVTQYLSRIPDRVRSALVGNVDIWAAFPLGAEDMRDGWKILQGQDYGWKPDDLVGGLAPHEAAIRVPGALLRVTTYPPSPSPAVSPRGRELVRQSSRRHSAVEDSLASPLTVSPHQLASLLAGLSPEGTKTEDEVRSELGWPPSLLSATAGLGTAMNLLTRSPDGTITRLLRGGFYLEALRTARNEGEDHTSLLCDAAAFLAQRGVEVRITAQGGGYLKPDAEFDWNGRAYHVEVECSTLQKSSVQVVRNARKAIAARKRCLLVVADRLQAERISELIASRVPEAELWEELGVMWRESAEEFVPYASADREPWELLTGQGGRLGSPTPSWPLPSGSPAAAATAADPRLGDLDRVERIVRRLARSGKEWVSAEDIAAADREGSSISPLDALRIGHAMASLGLESRRVRSGARQLRLYRVPSAVATEDGPAKAGSGQSAPNSVVPVCADAPVSKERGTAYSAVNRSSWADTPQPSLSGRLIRGADVVAAEPEQHDPSQDQEETGDLDSKESVPAVAGDVDRAEGVGEAGVVTRQRLRPQRSESGSEEEQDRT